MNPSTPFLRPATPRKSDILLLVDGKELSAQRGETVLSAILRAGMTISRAEADGTPRAGFCLMGACQDCTLWSASGERIRACMMDVAPGMEFCSRPPLRVAP